MKREMMCVAVLMCLSVSVFTEELAGNPFLDPANKFTLNYTIAPNELEDLALSSKHIAWGRNTLNVYDRGTSSLLPIVTSTQEIKDNITISDNFVAWMESPSADIFVYDLNSGTERLLGHGGHPVLTPDDRLFWYSGNAIKGESVA